MIRLLTAILLPIFLSGLLSATPLYAQQDPYFAIDEVNAGLGTVPDVVDRRTPRSSMTSFLRAGETGDWRAAAHLLDLSDIPVADQPRIGPLLAAQLHEVIERKALLDWSRLLDRPDALQVMGSQNEAMAGEPRRSLLLRELSLDVAPASIRLNRLKPPEGEAVWLFPAETVADVPALFDAYGTSELEKQLPAALRADAFWGMMWWELIGVPLLVIGAVGVGLLMRRGLGIFASHAAGPLATGILRAVRTPLMIVTVTTMVWWATRHVFVFSGNIDILIAPLIATGFVTALLLLIVNVVEAALDALVAPGEDIDLTASEHHAARALATKLNAAKRILVIVVSLVGIGIVLSSAQLFQGIGLSLLASAGALTLLLGFAARDILGNIMSSLQIAMNQSARVGDRVVFEGELCHVERIHLTFVQLRNWDGTRLVVPVKEFVSETFSNWTMQEPAMLRILKFKLDHRVDVPALREAFLDILRELSEGDLGPELGDLDQASVNVAGQDVLGMDIWFSTPCSDPNTSWEVACTVRERLLSRAAELEKSSGAKVFPEAASAAEAA